MGKLQLGVSSYSFAAHMRQTGEGYLAVCDRAKEMGFEGIEFIDLKPDFIDGKDVEAAADIIREHCAHIGLAIVAYTIGADFLKDDPEAEIARVKGCVDVAKRLGAPLMRHDATWSAEKIPDWREAVAVIAPRIREVAEYAQALGIRTCTENHGYFLQDSERVEALMRAVGRENYGWLVDIGNFICADEPSERAVEVAARYAFHVHAKDFLYKPADADNPGEGWFPSRAGAFLRGTIIGHGVIPVRRCVEILLEKGYRGWLSLEFEGMETPLTAIRCGLDNLRKYIGE